MYPGEMLNLFPPFPRTNMVFVAMSFDVQFGSLWTDVLQPAINGAITGDKALRAHRVDITRKSDSIVTEIVECIAAAQLIIADISTVFVHGRLGRSERPIRSTNVMYEVGIAHAARLPDEVILIRGDDDPLDFDVAGVRVHRYPDTSVEAKVEFIQQLIQDALKSIDQRRSLAVKRALRSFTPPMFAVLHQVGDIRHPRAPSNVDSIFLTEELDTIYRLLDGGMIEAVFDPVPGDFMERPSEDLFPYRPTPFGYVVYRTAREELHINDVLLPWLKSPSGQTWIESQRPRLPDGGGPTSDNA